MSIIEMRDVVKKYDNGTTALRGITVISMQENSPTS